MGGGPPGHSAGQRQEGAQALSRGEDLIPTLSARQDKQTPDGNGLPAKPRPRHRKSLGQYTLKDKRVLARILTAANIGPEDTIVEVGPGTGTLTQALAERAGRVIAIELDPVLVSLLGDRLGRYTNVSVVHGDILETDIQGLVGSSYKVVANLPYYIASPTIRLFLEAEHKPSLMVVMVQAEVARNIVAGPGRRSILSVAVQVYGRPSVVCRVPPTSFRPRPKVGSAVVAIDVYPEPLVKDVDAFFRVARAGFTAPRKQLHNSLALGLGMPIEEVKEALEAVGIDGRRRAGTLVIEEWDSLCRIIR